MAPISRMPAGSSTLGAIPTSIATPASGPNTVSISSRWAPTTSPVETAKTPTSSTADPVAAGAVKRAALPIEYRIAFGLFRIEQQNAVAHEHAPVPALGGDLHRDQALFFLPGLCCVISLGIRFRIIIGVVWR